MALARRAACEETCNAIDLVTVNAAPEGYGQHSDVPDVPLDEERPSPAKTQCLGPPMVNAAHEDDDQYDELPEVSQDEGLQSSFAALPQNTVHLHTNDRGEFSKADGTHQSISNTQASCEDAVNAEQTRGSRTCGRVQFVHAPVRIGQCHTQNAFLQHGEIAGDDGLWYSSAPLLAMKPRFHTA